MPGFDQVRPRSRILLQRFPGDARPACEERPSGWRTYRESASAETRARELDDGDLAAGEYALHWMGETAQPLHRSGPSRGGSRRRVETSQVDWVLTLAK